ncbi:hypothetical protein SAMN06272755_0424 [Picosynechococcus sp. OG1]|nr:hypothetical protein SAMN06272755_0424 [Picosynechococcus sp. OG1]SMQ84330.1 hypothetical protein SAMN06272774_2800 [Synechococcus sp. 7002]
MIKIKEVKNQPPFYNKTNPWGDEMAGLWEDHHSRLLFELFRKY